MRTSIAVILAATTAFAGAGAMRAWDERYQPPCPTHEMVIIGDSNVHGMDLGPQCVNLGVGGNTSKDMAARFNAKDVAALRRKTLVIWTTTNDIHRGENNGVRYIRQMAVQARAAGLHVILTTPLPMIDKALIPPRGAQSQAQVDEALIRLADQVRCLGRDEHFAVADIHAAVTNSDGSINMGLFRPDNDGSVVHLNRAGQNAVLGIIIPLTADEQN